MTPTPMEKGRSRHDFAFELSIKEEAGGSLSYVMAFYNPNKSTDHKRIVAHELQQVGEWQLKNLVGLESMERYYKNADFSMLHVVPSADSPQTVETPTLDLFLDDSHPTSVHVLRQIFLSICNIGSADKMPELLERIKGLPEQERLAVLDARTTSGKPGLERALRLHHDKVLAAYGDMLGTLKEAGLLTPAQVVELLAAWAPDGNPFLASALKQGEGKAVAAYAEMLKASYEDGVLSSAEVVELLAARSPDGWPALALAFNRGDARAK